MPSGGTRKNRRSHYTRKRRPARKVTTVEAKTKTSGKAQSTQILKLQKQLTSLKTKVGDNRQYAQFEINAGATDLTNGE